MRPIETWIALALLVVAGVGAAASTLPHRDRLEETCAPSLPPGEPVIVRASDHVRVAGSVATRTVDFTPAAWAAQALVRSCPVFSPSAERVDGEGTLRVVITARGEEPDRIVEDVEVKARAVRADGILVFAPRIAVHAVDHLPEVRVTMRAPANVAASAEAWP